MASADSNDLERPTIPLWVKVVVCALAIIGLLTIVKWILAAVFAVIWVLLIIAVLVAAAYALRAAARAKRNPEP